MRFVSVLTLTVLAAIAAPLLRAEEEKPAPSGFQDIIPKQIQAVDKALEWLAKSQGGDGSWGNEGSGGSYRMAMTGLAGLAFLSGGHTPGRGKYGRNIERAMKYVMKNQQRNDGLITSADEGQTMYGHGFATTFLAECYGMDPTGEKAEEIKKRLTEAVKLIAKSQSTLGGWYYSPNSGSDEGSVTITQVQALRACANNGIPVPKKTMENALKYIHKSQNDDGGVRYQANGGGSSSLALSAAGAELLLMAGQYDAKETKKVVEYLKRNLNPNATQGYHDFYTNFYGAQAMHQIGAKDWERYYTAIRQRLITSQAGNGSWSGDVGSTYCTAIGAMILSQPYDYIPIFQK